MDLQDKDAAAPPAAPQSFARRDKLRAIDVTMQAKWEKDKIFETDHTKTAPNGKFMATFPYPYMNGRLHLGHAFTLCKAEFAVRFQRLQGKNVLFPFAFHCTGMPIQAAANRLTKELDTYGFPPDFSAMENAPVVEKAKTSAADSVGKFKSAKSKVAKKTGAAATQWAIMKMCGLEDDEIPAFKDATHWLHYFPEYGMTDLKQFGVHVDWRRSFTTTDINGYYDAFIRWQFKLLKELDLLKFGTRPNVYSITDGQCCADHDRSSGEGVGPQEYTLVKLKIAAVPEGHTLADPKFADKTLYLAAATLRPETMFGQTNCFVLPEGQYGAFEINDTDVFVISERSAKNLAHQGFSKEWGKHVCLAEVTGLELCGLPLKAPNATYDVIYTLPLLTIKMGKGTGVVTSVPSDSPDDYAALRDLKNKAPLREKFNITEEMVLPFEVVPIIDIPGYGSTAAITVCDELKIKSQNDTEKLAEAKDRVYLKGFTSGIMLVGSQKGKKVCDAKPFCRKELLDSGDGLVYWEPENAVVGRSGDECVVAHTDQWYMQYGMEDWKNRVVAHVKGPNFNAFHTSAQQQFLATLDWMKEWAFSRQFGLGTKVPWDTQFVIESLSDSTVYMAYYTIAHYLQGADNLEGSKTGPAGITPDQLTPEVFDYLFTKKAYPADCSIPEELLATMRTEFEYWYPMDLRVSGKDLIPNHLTMSLYNHAAVWPDEKMWPRAFYGNGHIMVDAEKMSKSKGNFLMLLECVEKYGCDPTRFAIADAGDGMDDANFARDTANNAILNLTNELEWIRTSLADGGFRTGDMDFVDEAFLNEMNQQVNVAKISYETMVYRDALKAVWFELQIYRDSYRDFCLKKSIPMHKDVVARYIEVVSVCMSPIIPHWCEEVYCTLLGKAGSVCTASWPVTEAVDTVLLRKSAYIRDSVRTFRLALIKANAPKKGKAKASAPAAEPVKLTTGNIYIAKEFEEWKKKTLGYLSTVYAENGGSMPEKKELMGKLKAFTTTDDMKPFNKKVMQFVAFIQPDIAERGEAALATESLFDETALWSELNGYLLLCLGLEKVVVYDAADPEAPGADSKKQSAAPSSPTIDFV